MIEQYLQFAIQFIEEIWLQLNTMFGLEETQAFKFLKPYLLQVQDNPTYMGIAIALMALLPYSLYKIISIPRKRRKKLNEHENKSNELEKKLNERENKFNELEKKLNERENKFNELTDEMEDEEEDEEIDINDPRVIGKGDYDQAIAYFEEENYKEAASWFSKAAEQGHTESQYRLGEMYLNGEGVVQSDMEAIKWYKKAAEQGHAKAQKDLNYYWTFEEETTQENDNESKGGADAQSTLDDMYRIAKKDYDQAVASSKKGKYMEAFLFYKNAAEHGYAKAQLELGNLYYQGQGVTQSSNEAVKWYRKAAEQGDADAQCNLDDIYRIGGVLEEEYESDESNQQTQPICDEKKALGDFVEKTNHTEHIFADIINDLNAAIEVSVTDWPPLTLMAYGYTHRTAAAALYIKGLMTKDKYVEIKDVFKGLQIKTGGTVAFQEQAAYESTKFMAEYNKALTRSTIKGIVMIAEGCEIPPGESLSDAELLRRVKDVTETVTSKHGHAEAQEDDDIDVITRAVLETIPNEEIAYQFVLEEIEGASGGNEEARKFAKDSVFLRDEYEGAIRDSSPEVDGYSGPQQTLTRLTLGRLAGSSMDEMARVRIGVVKNVIKHWKLDEQSEL